MDDSERIAFVIMFLVMVAICMITYGVGYYLGKKHYKYW